METHRPFLLLTVLMTSLMTMSDAVFFCKDCVTHEELDEKLWEVNSLLYKLADFVNFKVDPRDYPDHFHFNPKRQEYPSQSSNSFGRYHPRQGGYVPPRKGNFFYKAPQIPVYPPDYYGIIYHYRNAPYLYNGQYYVAFLAKARTGKPIFGLYTGPGNNDTYPVRHVCGCVSLTDGYTSEACASDHYKSNIITEWNKQIHVDKVRVSVYKKGVEQAYFIFDGEGSTPMDFFSKDRFLFSPYEDLSKDATTNFFNIEGHIQRRFFINANYANRCKGDRGWNVVLDAKDSRDSCDWTSHPYYPVFLYAHADTSQIWQNGAVNHGDIFVISVKLRPYDPPLRCTDIRKCT